MVKVAKIHRQRSDELLSTVGLHVGQEMLLNVLLTEGEMTQAELANRLEIQPATLTVALKRLEKNGLVVRSRDPQDQRVSRVQPSRKSGELRDGVLLAWGRLEHEADWNHFTTEEMLSDPNKGEATNRSVMPLEKQGVIDLMDGETELAPGTTAFPAPGHTAGHMSLFIASNNERALLVGGILGSPMQATETDLHYWPDWDGPMGIKTIKDILDRAGREDSVVIRSHLSYPGWGTMIRWEGRRYWKDL